MLEIVMRRDGNKLSPTNQIFADDLAKLPQGKDLLVRVFSQRNLKLQAFLWVLASKVAEACDWMHGGRDDAMDELKIRCRHVKYLANPHTGSVQIIPRSLTDLDGPGLSRLANRMVYVVCKDIIPGLEESALRAEIMAMVSPDDKRNTHQPAHEDHDPVTGEVIEHAATGTQEVQGEPEGEGPSEQALIATAQPEGKVRRKRRTKAEMAEAREAERAGIAPPLPREPEDPRAGTDRALYPDNEPPEPTPMTEGELVTGLQEAGYLPPEQNPGADCKAVDLAANTSSRPSVMPNREFESPDRGQPSDMGAKIDTTPTTAAEYETYATAWLRSAASEQEIADKWNSERKLRNALAVISHEDILQRLLRAREIRTEELRKGQTR